MTRRNGVVHIPRDVVFKWVQSLTRSQRSCQRHQKARNMLRTTLVNRIASMSRRSSRKSDVKALEAHTSNTITSPSTTPKKGRKAVNVADDAVAKAKPAKSPRASKVKTEVHAKEQLSMSAAGDSTIVKDEVDIEVKPEPEPKPKPKKPAAKRKAKNEEMDEEDGKEVVTKKKRKTKEEKEAENVPLAERTVIATLKRSMHIGAHVSSAKGILEQSGMWARLCFS